MLRALTSRRGSTRLVRRVRILHAAHTPRTHTPRTPHVHAVLGSILTLEYSTPHTRRTRHKHWGAITAWRSRSVGVRLVRLVVRTHAARTHAARTPHVHAACTLTQASPPFCSSTASPSGRGSSRVPSRAAPPHRAAVPPRAPRQTTPTCALARLRFRARAAPPRDLA